MKKMYLLLVMMLSCMLAAAQKKDIKESEVPEAVKKVFLAKYPDSRTRTWKTKNGDYEVDFYIGTKKYEAKYNADGSWKKTGLKIERKDVPAAVLDAWKGSEYARWMLDGMELVETPDHKDLYLLKLVKGSGETELLYTSSGELLKAKNKN